MFFYGTGCELVFFFFFHFLFFLAIWLFLALFIQSPHPLILPPPLLRKPSDALDIKNTIITYTPFWVFLFCFFLENRLAVFKTHCDV